MLTPFALVDVDCHLPAQRLRDLAEACTIHATRDLGRASPAGWGVGGTVRVARSMADVRPGEWVIQLLAHPDIDGALGYHDRTPAGMPVLKVFPLLDDDDQLGVTLTHEIDEALCDPELSRLALGADGRLRAVEVGDPVERDSYEIKVSSGARILVTDFVTPLYFEPGDQATPGKYDFLGLVREPGEIRPGGYQSYYDPSRGWYQEYNSRPRKYREATRHLGRHASRHVAHACEAPPSTPLPLPAPGVCVALYGSWRTMLSPARRAILEAARPQIVMPHAGPRGILGRDPEAPDDEDPTALVADLRRTLPSVRVWLGVGLDGWTYYLHAHPGPRGEAVVQQLLEQLARASVQLGAEAVVPDAEAASAVHPVAGAIMARLFLAAFREHAPALPILLTSYDGPVWVHTGPGPRDGWGGHAVPWRSWLGPGCADGALWQVYAAPEKGMAAPGALARRFEHHHASVQAAIRAGLVRADLPHGVYLQAHHVPAVQTATLGLGHPALALWALGGSPDPDAEGALALRSLCELHRQGVHTPEQLEAWQRAKGLEADRVVGPVTRAALGVMPPESKPDGWGEP